MCVRERDREKGEEEIDRERARERERRAVMETEKTSASSLHYHVCCVHPQSAVSTKYRLGVRLTGEVRN